MDILRAVFNHVVLPPRVPGQQDDDTEVVSHDLLERIIGACETVAELAKSPWSEAFKSLHTSLGKCRTLHDTCLDRSTILESFRVLESSQTLILHVVQQNAALLVRRQASNGQDSVIFESFEASPISETVLAAPQALQWDFPGRSAQIPFDEFANKSFQENLAGFLEQANSESLYGLQAQTTKANVSVTEIRDTTDPALITEMLMSILEAMGSHFQPPIMRKRVRDEVNLKNAELPWRRLPFWLVLRVASQRQLSMTLGNECGRFGYKVLMCILLSKLLRESARDLGPDLTITLRAKLSRRMAKLEMDRKKISVDNGDVYEDLLTQAGPLIRSSIMEATDKVETAWKSHRKKTTLHVPRLTERVSDDAFRLSLPNSGKYLQNLLDMNNLPSHNEDSVSLDLPQPLDKATRQTMDFTDNVFEAAYMEMQALQHDQLSLSSVSDHEAECLLLEKRISELMETEMDLDFENKSTWILALFTLWVRLDKCAIAVYPLLSHYAPVFSPELLDALQLSTFSNMLWLQGIQMYLARRRSSSRFGTIFNETNEDCLAVRYVSQSSQLQTLGSSIQSASDHAEVKKREQWTKECGNYDELTSKMQRNTCCCTWKNGERSVRGCTRCYYRRARNRIKIDVHEAFLPKRDTHRAAILFELAIPTAISAYRDTTWRMLISLTYPSPVRGPKSQIKLGDCSPLQPYITARSQTVSLASNVKCFEQTHYKFQKGKVPIDRLVVPFGAIFKLYDNVSDLWVKDQKRSLTLQHKCGIHVPHALRTTVLPSSRHPPPDIDGPSSYQIQANQTECPSDISVHEFSAYQKLLAGKNRRWWNIIVELGSSNLNFSSEDTMLTMSALSAQAGPQLTGEALRHVHVVFREELFLERLAEVIQSRMHTLLSNWREHNSMELLVALSLRFFHLTSGDSRLRAEALLKAAREATLNWTVCLRRVARIAVDGATVEQTATYSFHAALLCRRTFAIYAEHNKNMEAEDLISWVQASVTLQENILVDTSKLPPRLKRMLVRDRKMVFQIQTWLRRMLMAHPATVGVGISRIWSESPDGTTTLFGPWTFLRKPNDRWIVATTSPGKDGFRSSQVVHYNFVDGHVLVNGRPRVRLPLDIRNNSTVKDLFPGEHLLTYPSHLHGMTHRLVSQVEGQEVHFGMRGTEVIIRTVRKHDMFEFVPPRIFSGGDSFDLPSELVHNCAHWLDLVTGVLKVHRMPKIWVARERDWSIDLQSRTASRARVKLINPQSEVFSRVAKIFRNFVSLEMLTIYQPISSGGSLSVDLRHLGLSFYVNRHGGLHCRELKAMIDPDQDAGTWYGLRSKIVMRDRFGKRSIILPLGKSECKRDGIHVKVHMRGALNYGRYDIDEDLCQLSCPPEPLLLYTKAFFHAITSFCLPDNLTRRTGTEEAFRILRSAAAQPWRPLENSAQPILKQFESLFPLRAYYPSHIKRLQTVTWDINLTTTIQQDGYEVLIRTIINRSNQLSKFSGNTGADCETSELSHLRQRGEMRRRLYERLELGPFNQCTEDKIYDPRGRHITSRAANVYEIARLVTLACFPLTMDRSLKSVFESWKFIGGFHSDDEVFTTRDPLLTQIEVPLNERWGKLANFCQHVGSQASLLFRLGLLAFGPNPNLDAIRALVGFGVINKLKNMPLPAHSSYMDFAFRSQPSLELLDGLISPAYHKFRPIFDWSKQDLRDVAGRTEQEHLELCKNDGKTLARHLLDQWPSSADLLSTDTYETEVIDVPLAMEKIKPEWTRRQENHELELFATSVQEVLDFFKCSLNTPGPKNWMNTTPVFIGWKHSSIIPSLAQDLLTKEGPSEDIYVANDPFEASSKLMLGNNAPNDNAQVPKDITELESIVVRFSNSPDSIRKQYGGDLLESLAALKDANQLVEADAEIESPSPNTMTTAIDNAHTIDEAIEQARETVRINLKRVSSALAANDPRSTWLQLSDLWTCTAPTAVLAPLRLSSSNAFGARMKEALVSYGISITILQRLKRIRRAFLGQEQRVLKEELLNPGHENWIPLEQPKWLLLEVDGNFLIRPEQADVARSILAPLSGANSVLQMNMGKGESVEFASM